MTARGKGKLCFWAIAAAIGLTAALALLVGHRIASERQALSRELAPFLVPPMVIGGVTYHVRRGVVQPEAPSLWREVQVLRLARYAVLARIDPIFALAGVEIERLRAAVEALEDGLAALAEGGALDEYQSLVRELYPVSFLKTLPDLEALRREVITRPEPAVIRRYQTALERSNAEALRSVARYRENLRWAEGNLTALRQGKTPGDLYFLRTVTDVGTIDAAMEEIAAGMRGRRKDILDRRGCLWAMRSCGGELAFGWQRASAAEPRRITGAPTSPVSPEALKLLGAPWLADRMSIDKRTLWVLTPCFGKRDLLQPFRIVRRSPAAVEARYPGWERRGLGGVPSPQPLDNLYFFTIAKGSEAAQRFWGRLTDHGFPVFWKSPTVHTCPDMSYFVRLLSYRKVAAVFSEQPLPDFPSVSPADAAGGVAGQGERIAGGASLTEYDFERFFAKLGAFLLSADEPTLAERFGSATVLAAEEVMAMGAQHSSAFDEVLTTGVFRTYRILQFQTRYVRPGDLANAYSLRFHLIGTAVPSIYFLPFNATFVGSAQPRFVAERPVPVDSPFLDLGALGKHYTGEEISEIMKHTELAQDVFPPFPIDGG